ncbi:MAG: YraN family protein [Lachnospiraceae bacterium]|nr:YraN family protein [Lachnospiraceae bacterium]
MQRNNTRKLGGEEERLAASYLERNGCHIVEMNYRVRYGEIDIIYTDGGTICFGEVKYRKSEAHGLACQAVNFRKQRKISRVSDYFRAANSLSEDHLYRFDVIAISGKNIQWIKNAFNYIR